MRSTMLFAVAALLITAANAREVDPAGSELWEDLSGAYLGEDAEVTFDDSIRLMMADRVESAHEVSDHGSRYRTTCGTCRRSCCWWTATPSSRSPGSRRTAGSNPSA